MATSTLTELPKEASAPAIARRIVGGIDRLRPEARVNARLLVSELVANAVRHVRSGDCIGLAVEMQGGALHVEVVDPGTGFVPRARTERSPLGSGWGLHLVDQLSDRWGVDNAGPTRVWFEIDHATA